MQDDTVLVVLERERLTDGSYVFNVSIGPTKWRCVGEKSAYALQEAIVSAARKNAMSDTVAGECDI